SELQQFGSILNVNRESGGMPQWRHAQRGVPTAANSSQKNTTRLANCSSRFCQRGRSPPLRQELDCADQLLRLPENVLEKMSHACQSNLFAISHSPKRGNLLC